MCLKNINNQAGYKCGNCPITLCLNCANRIIYGKKKTIHNHYLTLKNRNSWKCDLCKKMYKGKASFYCKFCDLDACDRCYFEEPQQEYNYQQGGYGYQGQTESKFHEHLLNYYESLSDTCKLCLQNIGGKDGYKCNVCLLSLCFSCHNKIIYRNKQKSIHPHDLLLRNNKAWKCDLCRKIYRGNASFNCKSCDFDACDK